MRRTWWPWAGFAVFLVVCAAAGIAVKSPDLVGGFLAVAFLVALDRRRHPRP